MRRRVLLILILGAGLGGAAPAAHEIGTTRVSATFTEDGRYQVDIVTDAAALIEKLAATRGTAPPPGADPSRLGALLPQFGDVFRRRILLAFDDAPAEPAVAYSVADAAGVSAPTATIRLTGIVPAGVRTLRWTYGWTFASYALSVRRSAAAEPVTHWLEGGDASPAIDISAPSPGHVRTAGRYAALGFTHIVPGGLDHVLFVLGIYLLSRRPRWVLWQVSAFTVAHSITLALAMFGIVTVSPAVVEPLIALSIAYVAIENALVVDATARRVALVFGFGLLHGLGFAGALQELGLPAAERLTALVAFNLGVEAGQLAVIAAAFLLVGWRFGGRDWYRRRVVLPASALIAVVALYWTLDRLAASAVVTRTIAFIVG